MKIQTRQIESFIKKPDPAVRVILIYGPDAGLMRERAGSLGLTVVPDLNDPFNVTVLTAETLLEDPARLCDEARALSMMGGDRLIRVENASDKIAPLVKDYLAEPSAHALVLLLAGELGPASTLRKLCEKEASAAALPCYVEEEKDLARLIQQLLEAQGLSIEADAQSWLAANIGGDRQRARGEIEKLVLYMQGFGSRVTLADAQAACGAAGTHSLDALVYSTGGQRPAEALHALEQLTAEEVSSIAIVRALQNHFRRLHLVRSKMDAGETAEDAMRTLRPPVFFKQEQAFRSQAARWRRKSLEKVLERLVDLEAQCKQTAMPADALCAQAILGINMARL